MITELYAAPHSTIDPETEAIQIAGRFRKGFKNLTHITNYNKKLEYKDPATLTAYLEGQHNIYMELLKMLSNAKDLGEKHILQQALECVDYSRFVNNKGEKDYFMYDNAFRDEYVKSIYTYPYNIRDSFANSGKFEVLYHYIQSAISDTDRKTMEAKNISKVDLNKLAYHFIKNHLKLKNEYDNEYIKCMGKSYELIFEAFTALGEKELLKTDFREADIKRAIADKKADSRNRSKGVITAVHNTFSENSWYSTNEINDKLKKIYTDFGLRVDRRGMASKITLYFDATANKGDTRGWKLNEKII
jgi:recombinational DNA repair protein RecR